MMPQEARKSGTQQEEEAHKTAARTGPPSSADRQDAECTRRGTRLRQHRRDARPPVGADVCSLSVNVDHELTPPLA